MSFRIEITDEIEYNERYIHFKNCRISKSFTWNFMSHLESETWSYKWYLNHMISTKLYFVNRFIALSLLILCGTAGWNPWIDCKRGKVDGNTKDVQHIRMTECRISPVNVSRWGQFMIKSFWVAILWQKNYLTTFLNNQHTDTYIFLLAYPVGKHE